MIHWPYCSLLISSLSFHKCIIHPTCMFFGLLLMKGQSAQGSSEQTKGRSFATQTILWPNAKMAQTAIQTSSAVTNLPAGTQPPPSLPPSAPWGSTWEVLPGLTTLMVATECAHASAGGRVTLIQDNFTFQGQCLLLFSLGHVVEVDWKNLPSLDPPWLGLFWMITFGWLFTQHLVMSSSSHHWSPEDLVSIYCWFEKRSFKVNSSLLSSPDFSQLTS